MTYCVVEFRTLTATFRNPEFQNFHKTLHLPPPTTLVGLAGAALGKSPRAAQSFFENGDWQIGIWGTSEGYAKDLWKYNNFEGGSIVLREIMYDNCFVAVFGSKDEVKVRQLQDAFINPYYALTLGSSDSLAKVVAVEIVEENTRNKDVAHCLMPGNILADVLENAFSGEEFTIYATSEPVAYDLPVRFQYESDYGVRRVSRRKTVSFVGEPMQLNFPAAGISYKDRFIPIFTLHDEDPS